MQPPAPAAAPAPLKVAASLAALEALVLLGLAVAELLSTSGDRLLLGLTTTLFFLLYGGVLLAASWLVTRPVGWARGPVLLAQLIQLGLAWTVRDVVGVGVLVALVLVSVVVLVGMLHPASLQFMLGGPGADDDEQVGGRD
ncbi:hypothetical protein GCM10009737_36230 [Nocardioides lentus]|uniref:DUF2568 domain-containing protein n=1 Tax=Nocardioides lentus TaxID=338077 RepID=A0ABN2PTJ5_9ACTN